MSRLRVVFDSSIYRNQVTSFCLHAQLNNQLLYVSTTPESRMGGGRETIHCYIYVRLMNIQKAIYVTINQTCSHKNKDCYKYVF